MKFETEITLKSRCPACGLLLAARAGIEAQYVGDVKESTRLIYKYVKAFQEEAKKFHCPKCRTGYEKLDNNWREL